MAWYGLTSSNGTTTLIDFDKVSQVISYKGGSIIYIDGSTEADAKSAMRKVVVKEPLDRIAKLVRAKIA